MPPSRSLVAQWPATSAHRATLQAATASLARNHAARAARRTLIGMIGFKVPPRKARVACRALILAQLRWCWRLRTFCGLEYEPDFKLAQVQFLIAFHRRH